MKPLCLLLVGIVLGWAASSVDWSREAVAQDAVKNSIPATGKANASTAAVEAAQAALAATEVNYQYGKTDVETVYRWSRRVMEAESALGDASAAERHLQRMIALKGPIDASYSVGGERGSAINVAAVAFYVAEAEELQRSTAD